MGLTIGIVAALAILAYGYMTKNVVRDSIRGAVSSSSSSSSPLDVIKTGTDYVLGDVSGNAAASDWSVKAKNVSDAIVGLGNGIYSWFK